MVGYFRLTKPTIAVLAATRLAVIIPEGAVIEIPVAASDGNRMVDVIWNCEAAMMFVADLQSRSKSV